MPEISRFYDIVIFSGSVAGQLGTRQSTGTVRETITVRLIGRNYVFAYDRGDLSEELPVEAGYQ